ncbi:MAG: hypothetical protein J7J91_11290, partial [Deltaproteobacteria bacterium]|nr:hypothetical protein [Deltaproteobacteria bacterium]
IFENIIVYVCFLKELKCYRFNDRSKEFLFGQQPVNWPPTSVPSRSAKELLINANGCASMANYLYPA